ncbi:MAG TPA: alkylmercury lyase family protein [Streptosporangiaceae bacterium]|nr:alkylmercury lyase family protein [Streptosporangiaceae bacterium]
MHLTVLAEPGCPSAPVLKDRLAAVLDGPAGISLSKKMISGAGEAARWGMRGSPTLLVDGVDPFAESGQAPSMSCRLYRDENGQTSGAPSTGQLRQAIEQALAPATEPGDLAWLDSVGRAGRGRIAPAERGLRAVHQAVLRSFVRTGAAPAISSLAEHAEPFNVSQVLAELADGDFLYLDPAGQITAAYPFSALPTRHRVRISGGSTVFAMCAIDALGVSAMAGLPVVIESADPSTGEPITVNVDGANSTWDPPTAVVYVGRTAGERTGPSASVCCGYMNFFTSRAAASAWAASHPDITGGILGKARASQVGISIFGQLLT